jgi:hypothetical protein
MRSHLLLHGHSVDEKSFAEKKLYDDSFHERSQVLFQRLGN